MSGKASALGVPPSRGRCSGSRFFCAPEPAVKRRIARSIHQPALAWTLTTPCSLRARSPLIPQSSA